MKNDHPTPKRTFSPPKPEPRSLQDMPGGFVLALIQIATEQPALVGYFQTEPMPDESRFTEGGQS